MPTAQSADRSRESGHSGDCETRRHSIVLAADSLLGEAGLDGLTVRALLARTGLARRAFYEGFPGKDDLVLAVFERVISTAANHFNEHFAKLGDPVECIRYFVTSIVVGNDQVGGPDRRGAALSREHMRLAESRPGELADALRPLLACLAEQVERGIEQGQLRAVTPALQAALIYNLLATTTHTELLREEESKRSGARDKLAEAIWDFCKHAIMA